MLAQPQHPIHYAFGIVSHAPSVMEAWVHERLLIKIQYHVLYLAVFLYAGYIYAGMGMATDLAGIGILSTFLMSLPAQVLNGKKFTLQLLSDSYFNAVLAFHGFFLSYFVAYNIVTLLAAYFGFWTLGTSNALISLSTSLMIGYSTQLAVTSNYKLRWFFVPLVSIGLGYGMFRALSTAGLPH